MKFIGQPLKEQDLILWQSSLGKAWEVYENVRWTSLI